MTAQNRSVLKAKFENGDIPVESDFEDLIDSSLNLSETATQTIQSDITVPVVSAQSIYANTMSLTTLAAGVANVGEVSASAVWHANPFGELYVTATAATSGSAAGTFMRCSGFSTLGAATQFDSPTAMRLRYLGAKQAQFLVQATISVTGNRNDLRTRLRLAKDGSTISKSSQNFVCNSSGRSTVMIQAVTDLSANQYIEPHITCDNSASAVWTVDSFNMTAVPINFR